jgi:Flp pilus assembly protein TadB
VIADLPTRLLVAYALIALLLAALALVWWRVRRRQRRRTAWRRGREPARRLQATANLPLIDRRTH